MLQRIEHALVQVADREAAVSWYTDVYGLVEVAREDGVVYLGAGLDDRYDLAVREGEPGLDHFAVKADSVATVERVVENLAAADVAHRRLEDPEPGEADGVRFQLPTGATMEVVTVAELGPTQGYEHSDEGMVDRRGGVAPVDFDHITFLSADLRADVTFLEEVVGMQVSEIAGPDDAWEMAFIRCNNVHHDVAMRQNPDPSATETGLHHLAWEFDGIEHMKLMLDHVCRSEVSVERGIGRHYAGDNLYAYFWEPGGFRFEICAEMALIETAKTSRATSYEEATVAWGPGAPQTFSETVNILDQ